MPYNVQLPDGRIVEGIPDDVSQLDAKKRILEAFPEIAAKEKRGWGEAITDVGASLASGVGALAQVPGQLTQLTGLTKAEDANKGLQGLGKQLEEFGQESKSAVLKGKEAVRAQKIDQAEGMLAEFGTAIKETIRDPALLTSFFAEQLPNLAGSWGGGLLARGATKALMAEATGAALGKAGVRGAIGTGAVMQGADIGSETYEAVYKEAKKQGMDDEQANGIALSKGRVAGIEAAMLSLAVTKLPGGATIEKAMAGKGLPTVGGFSRGLFGEAVSEGLEEGGGKFASNVGVQEVNPETSLTKGVGSAAGMGALGGGFFGGVAGYTESRAKAMEDKRAEIEAARNKAMETGETQTLALPYDPNVNAQPIMYVYPDGTMAFPSEANNFANENAQELSQEALEEQYAPQRVPEVITPNSLKEMGFAAKGGKPFQEVRASLIGKDIRDPAQAAEVKTILENYAEKTTSTKTIEGITKFLERPEFQPAPVEEVIAEPKKRERKPKVVAEQTVAPEEVAQEVVKPKRRMKALKPTAEELLSIQEQDLIRQELEDEQAALNQQSAGETPTAISGSSEPSVRVPSDGVTTPTGTDQSQRRGMVPVGNDVGQPIGGAAPVQRTLEASGNLNKRQIKEFDEARDKYFAGAVDERTAKLDEKRGKPKGDPQEVALRMVAADLFSGENLKEAKRFHRGLPEAAKAYVADEISRLESAEKKTDAEMTRLDAITTNQQQTAEAQGLGDIREKLSTVDLDLLDNRAALDEAKDNNDDKETTRLLKKRKSLEERAEALREQLPKEEPKKKAKKTNPKLERIDAGKTTDNLINAVRAGNLNAALNAIAKDTSDTFNILEKLVSNRLLANKGSLPKIEIVPAGTIQDGAAQYNPFTDTVQINEGEVDSHTVLHETVHGFLHALITKFEGEAGVKNKGISDLKELYEFIKRTEPGLVEEYGMESLTEFASELMSNRQFQETLAQIPYRVETQSLFTAFIRAVLNALGLSPTQKLSALASGLIAADRTLAIGRKIQEDVVTGKETMPIVKNVALGTDLGLVDKTTAGFTPKRINTILRTYAYGTKEDDVNKTKAYVGYVSPEDFLNATTTSPENLKDLETDNRTKPLDEKELAGEIQDIYLTLDEDFNLTGHEGRHRMIALRNAGIKRVPVIFSFYRGEDRFERQDQRIPPQRFSGDLVVPPVRGQKGFYADLVPLTYVNKERITNIFGAKEGQVAFLKRNDLDTLYKATGAGSRAKPTVATGPFQAAKETFRDTAAAKQGLARFLNTAETMLFSADAALNNAIRKGLESGGRSWDTIKQMMYDISTAQATHADAVAMQFLEKGNVVYDEQVRKWVAKENKDSWAGLVNQISDLAKKYNVEFETMNNYAQEAFVAERLKGLSKSKQEIFSHKTPAQIEAGVKFFDAIPELRTVQKSWNAVRKNAMDVAVQGGLYSEEQAKELLDIMDYVPFYRIEQLAQNAGPKEYGRGLIDFAKGYKIAGSEQEVANIFDNMERWTSYTVSRAVKNRTALNLKNAAEQFLPEGEVVKLRQDERVHREQNTIDIWENGQRTKYEFKDPLFIHAFNGIEAAAIPHFGAASAVANFLRKNIVLMPLFSISQLSQDSFGAMLTSGLKHPWLLPLEVAKEFVNTLRGRSAAAKELTKYGAVGVRDYSATMVRDTAEIMAGLKQNTKTGKFKQALENFAMASDNAVRQAIYNMTLKETGDKALAVERAFEIINFKRAGASGKIQMMRQVVPFFGAYLQAQNVVYKTLSGKGITPQQKKEAHRVLISNALKISALAFMYAAIASDDEDYQKMDPQIRDRHLLIPGTAFMLPMRSDLTLMPKLIAEYAYLGMTDNAFTDGKKIRRAMGNALFNAVASPTAVPQAFKPILEVATNHDFFTGRSIIGQGIANKITEEQYTNNTSELAKLLGKTGMIAPVNVDHLIKGYLGTTGGLGLQMTSAIINSTKDQPKPEKSWQDAIATTPGLSAFVAREYGNADKNDFYELREEVDKVNNTINAMRKQGRIEEAKELLAENKDLLKTRTQISNINNQLSKLREYENHVYSLPEARMNAEKKGVEIRRIREQEKKLLANVNGLRRTAGY